MREQRKAVLLLTAALLLCASPARADAASALALAPGFHLLFGNLLIGLLEGALLAKLFRLPFGRAVRTMLAANYLSAGIALVLLVPAVRIAGGLELDRVPFYDRGHAIQLYFAYLFAGTFAATVLLEWPFCWRLLAERKRALRLSFAASLLAQSVSYVLLVPFYLSAFEVSVYHDWKLDPSLAFVARKDALVYFIGADDGNVYRIGADGTRRERVLVRSLLAPEQFLYFEPEAEAKTWELRVANYPAPANTSRLLSNLRGEAGHGKLGDSWGASGHALWATAVQFGVEGAASEEWSVWTEPKPSYGLYARNMRTQQRRHAGLETPFGAPMPENCTQLPGAQFVYQLGHDILIGDAATTHLGWLSRGRGPAVLLPSPAGRKAGN